MVIPKASWRTAAPANRRYLLHRHALRQIARLVDVGAFGDGRVIGEKLHGQRIDERREQCIDFRDFDGRPGAFAGFGLSTANDSYVAMSGQFTDEFQPNTSTFPIGADARYEKAKGFSATLENPGASLYTSLQYARMSAQNGRGMLAKYAPSDVPAWRGRLAALVMTLTPITVAIDRDNNPDTLLVLLLVLAAWACQRAVASGRLGWLAASAFFLGCGFNTKMLQAYLLLSALFVVYLCFAAGGWWRRVWHLAVAGVVLAVSSFWWMIVVDLVPARSRPYIGGNTDNTVWDLVIGYNGLGRVLGGGGGPAGGGSGGGPGGRAGGGFGGGTGGGPTFAGTSGWGRLFNDILGGQISWLLPFATVALVAGVILLWRRPRTDLRRAAVVLWGGWLAVHFTVFSLADGIMHPYYTTALAPAVASTI